jgi:glycosyltransferase involved in cell wall biosynthesis
MTDRIVIASPGGWDAPSAQRRLGALSREGPWPADMISAGSFPTEEQLHAIAAAAGSGATLILQRVLPAPSQMARLRAAYDRVVFDMDDAIYAVPPDLEGSRLAQAARAAARLARRGYPRASARRRPLIKTLREVDACVAGNAILAAFAHQHCPRVIEIPTTVSPVQEIPPRTGNPALVWVGVAHNLQYLGLIADPLRRLRKEIEFRFTVVSSEPWVNPTVPTEFVRWSNTAELDALLGARVGVAPLTDDPWTRGKCAFRAILYGGHALPTVASPVGITDQVVIEGETGVYALTTNEWMDALGRLLTDPDEAAAMGERAWQQVCTKYSDQVSLRMWRELLSD